MKEWGSHDILLRRTAVVLALSFLSLSFVSSACASLEYVYLTGRGNSMYPTIKDGDMVKVKVCTDGNLINVGDIITYSVIVTNNPHPDYMWIGHRVIEKHQSGETWYFRTKGDNNPQPDPWEIPDYFLLGVVVEINPDPSQAPSEPKAVPRTSPTSQIPEGTTLLSFVDTIASIALVGIGILLFLKIAEEELTRISKQKGYYS